MHMHATRSSPKDSKYTILVIGLTNPFDLVLRRTERTRLSLLKLTSITKPRGHHDLGVFSSTIKTMSPAQNVLLVVSHLERFCSMGRYSRVQRLQNTFARN